MFTHDQYGNTIEAGDYISYPVRKGSELYVQTGRVLRVETRNRKVGKKTEEQVVLRIVANSPTDNEVMKRVTISRPDRTIVLPKSYVQHAIVYHETRAEVKICDDDFWPSAMTF